MKGHVPTRPIACHAAGCESKGQNGFYREDKFYKHVREHHDVDTEWICPEKHCNIEPMCADELVSHLVKDHDSDFKLWRFYRYVAVLPVTVPDKLMCPLGDCTIPIPPHFYTPVPPSRIRIAKSLRNHLEVVHECRLATELATILSDGGSYFKEVDISKFKKGNGVCPICQTDVLAWNGHNLGDHIRQIHGPDAVYACEPEIKNQKCFKSYYNDRGNNWEFKEQFPELMKYF